MITVCTFRELRPCSWMVVLLLSAPFLLSSLTVTDAFVPVASGGVVKFVSAATAETTRTRPLQMGLFDGVGSFMKRFTTRATASHILIKGGAEAENKLEDVKAEIGDSPVKFAEYAGKLSECPSGREGGNLGSFGPGAMVKEFDKVVFNEEVGKVHGPIKTQFGYHLIYINDRTE